MSTATAISVSEYLNTSYRPDCDYIDGELLERNVGEWDHSRLQIMLGAFFLRHEKEWNIAAVTEQRVQVKATRFRIPDITVMAGGNPGEQIITRPPFLCIEILSPSDRIEEMHDRIDDYLTFGVSYVWLINPRTRQSWIHTRDGIREAKGGILNTKNPDIQIDLSSLE